MGDMEPTTETSCSVDGCGRRVFHRGLCRTHYRRGEHHEPRSWGDKRKTLHEALMAYANAEHPGDVEVAWQRLWVAMKRMFRAPGSDSNERL